MTESQKGTSAAADSKKSSSFGSDGDFGKDFLSSWKSSKKGKDQIDFVVDSAPRNMKKAFNFDKLDDFELGGDFDKLSSFKMDMSDLDFSSPLKKTEKPKGKSCEVIAQGKKEAKHDKFSFNFVFNELDNFEIDTNLLKEGGRKHDNDKELIMHDENQQSDIHEKSRHSRGFSAIKTDVSEDNEVKRVPISEGMGISSSEHLVEPNTANFAGPTILDYGLQDVSHEAVISTDKELIVVEENKNAKHSRPSFSLLSVSGDSSAQQAIPKFEKRLACLDTAEANPARELDDTARSVDSSQSRNSGPVNSNNSRCWRRTSSAESPNSTGDSQKLQGNQIEATSGTIDPSESTKCHKVDNACATNFSQKIDCQSKFTSDKLNSGPKLLPSPVHRGSLLGKSMSLNAKTTAVLQLKPLTKSAENELQPTSVQIQKQLCAVDSGKLQTTNVYPSNENRESKQNVETTVENQHGSILKSQLRSLAEGISIVTGSVKSDNFDTSHLQLPLSDLPGKTTANITVKNILPNLLSGTATKKTFQKTSIERQAISLNDGKICDKASFKLPGITKSNINTSNFTKQKETKLVRFLERKLDLPLNAASRTSNSAITKTYTLSSPSLKRKIIEESRADPEMLNPSKRVMESPTDRRKSLEASPAIDKKVVLGTRNQGNASMDNLASPKCFPEMRSVPDLEVPVLIENDGNVEKAEACAKELEDICNMLKKKQEEAKELLVRVMVNNNALLMLNHPMHDEKIHTLQRFASSLQSREF